MMKAILNRSAIMELSARNGLNVAGLIRKSGVSPTTMINIMGCTRNPRTDTIYKIAKALGVDVKDIARWEEVEK